VASWPVLRSCGSCCRPALAWCSSRSLPPSSAPGARPLAGRLPGGRARLHPPCGAHRPLRVQRQGPAAAAAQRAGGHAGAGEPARRRGQAVRGPAVGCWAASCGPLPKLSVPLCLPPPTKQQHSWRRPRCR
jgi:hypothetical protein